MGVEIERKFLVRDSSYKESSVSHYYKQGYLSCELDRTVRVRIADDKGYITVKGQAVGITRPEFEYEIPLEDAGYMLDHMCVPGIIEKVRYITEINGLTWEIDEFKGLNEGLTVAEVELSEEGRAIVLPEWIGEEITGIPAYYNSNLSRYPYSKWRSQAD